jgi:hypothetical protein
VIKTATSLTTHDFLPARLAVPCAVVMPSSPYVADGDVFGSFTASFTVDLVMGQAANKVTANGLDDQIENALVGLVNAGYSVESVSQPYSMEVNNATYLAATVTVNAQITP